MDSIRCQTCADPLCAQCSVNRSVCERCHQPLGLTPSGICDGCHQNLCDCSYNVSYCYNCVFGSKSWVNFINTCPLPCFFAYCQECEGDYFICTKCSDGYGVILFSPGFYHCSVCSDSNCLKCPTNYMTCIECASSFGVKLGKCVSCNQSSCLNCSNDYLKCSRCLENYQIHQLKCILCDKANCVLCPNSDNHCELCVPGYFNNIDGDCVQCDTFGCLECFLQTLPNETQICTKCIDLCYLEDGECKDICGDSVTLNLPCDKQIGIQLDGCDDDCNVSEDFNCTTKIEQRRSICSFTEEITLTFEQFSETENLNEFVLAVKVFPPLHIFQTMSKEQILSSFSLGNQEFSLMSANYDSTTNKFFFTVKIASEIKSDSFLLHFLPKSQITEQYFGTPNVTAEMNYDFSNVHFYSNTVLSFVEIAKYLCFATVFFVWMSVIIGIVIRDTFGIQAMFVVQMAFVSFLWMNTSFISTYKSVSPLQYSFGYNYGDFIRQNISNNVQKRNEKTPFTLNFEISDSFLVNNFSFFFIFILISTIIALGLCSIYKIQKKKVKTNEVKENEDDSEDTQKTKIIKQVTVQNKQNQNKEKLLSENNQSLKNIQQKYDFSLQFLLHCVSVSLIPFVSFSVILFSQNKMTDISNIIIFALSVSIVIFALLMFHFYPYRFVDLLNFYKLNFLPQKHFFVHIFVIILSTVSLCVFPSLPFVPLIFLGSMFLFTVIVRPHSQMKNNVRSVFNYFVMCTFIGFELYAQRLTNLQLSSNSTMFFIFVLILLCTVPTFVSLVFHFMHFSELRRTKEQMNVFKTQREHIELQVLKNLVKTDVQKKMKNVENTFFKDLLPPKQSIRSLSKQLREKLKQNYQQKTQSKQNEHRINNQKPFDFDQLNWKQTNLEILDETVNEQSAEDSEQKTQNNKLQITQNVIENEFRYIDYRICKDRFKNYP